MIVGEALAALRRTDPELAGRISDLARIIAFRNILVHGYAGVDDRLVWGVIETELATLVSTLDTLMAAFPDQP